MLWCNVHYTRGGCRGARGARPPPPAPFTTLCFNSTAPPPPAIPWGVPATILGIDFYSGFRKKAQGGGGAIRNPTQNPGIDLYSGFRKTSQGGGGGAILKKWAPVTSKPESATVYRLNITKRF